MDKNNLLKTAFIIGILLLIVGDVVATAATDVTVRINCIVCRVAVILLMITIIIAGIVILMAGIKWVGSPDDPAARGAARLTIIHTFIGLIIVIIALFLINYVVGTLLPGTIDPTKWITDSTCVSSCPT